jgi:hypothetical protein
MSSTVSVPGVTEHVTTSRVWFPFHITLAGVLFITTFFFCGRSIADPDIWWHLKNAQILVEQHHWMRWDQFSYTVAGTPWINTEWLSEVMFYAAWRAGRETGVFLLYLGLAESIMLGILYLAYKASGSIKAASLASLFAVLLAVVNFGPRTILFGWGCLVLLMLVLWTMLKVGRAPLWSIPLIFLFWVNFHGSWLIGFVIFCMVIACGFIEGEWGNVVSKRWTRSQAKQMLMSLAMTIPVLFVNPYGYKYVFYPFDLAYRQKLNVSHVEEWASIDFHEPRGKIVYALIMLLFLLVLSVRQKWKLAEVAMVCFALYASLTYVRFLFLAAILLAPILARHMDFVPPYQKEIDRSWLNVVFCAVLLGIVMYRMPSARELNENLVKAMPTESIRYVEEHSSPGDRTFNHYMFGGYMIWSTPALKTFIDSRTDIFEYKGILKDYLDAIQLKDPLEIMDKYHVKFVMFPGKDPVAYVLRQSVKWKLVHEDRVAFVFERVEPSSK